MRIHSIGNKEFISAERRAEIQILFEKIDKTKAGVITLEDFTNFAKTQPDIYEQMLS